MFQSPFHFEILDPNYYKENNQGYPFNYRQANFVLLIVSENKPDFTLFIWWGQKTTI